MQLKVHWDSDGGGDIHSSGRSRAELPVADGTDRRLVKIVVSRGTPNGHGRGIAGGAYRYHEKNDTLSVFDSSLLRVDGWGIAEVIRLGLTSSFLPAARCLGFLGQGVIGGWGMMTRHRRRRRLKDYWNRRLRNGSRRGEGHVIRDGFLDVGHGGGRWWRRL